MDIIPTTLRHLRAFHEVGLKGQISSVADMLFMSQPAVSQALANIETRHGIQFFHRQAQGLVLTDAGVLMHSRIGRAMSYLETGATQATTRRSDAQRLTRQMTMTQLRAIVAIADHGGFSAGAQAIGTSQPAISRAARDLERICGRALIEKTGRGIVLTKAADALVQAARLAVSELRYGEDEIRALQGTDTSVLTIGSLPLARSAVLPKAILSFAADNPDVEIRVIDGPYNDLLTGLRRGEIDVLIGALRMPPPFDDILELPLFSDSLSIVARLDHPLAGLKNLSEKDLREFPWVVPRKGTPTRDYFNQFVLCAWGGVTPHIIEASSLILVRGLLAESDTLTMISDQQLAFDLSAEKLTRLDFNLDESDRPIGLSYRRGWLPTDTQSRFLSEIKAAIKDLPLVVSDQFSGLAAS